MPFTYLIRKTKNIYNKNDNQAKKKEQNQTN